MLPIVLAFIAALCFGVSKVLIRKAANVDSFVSTLYTLVIAAPILCGFAVINGDAFATYHYEPWTIMNLALSGLIWLALGRVFAYASINLIGAARASQLTSTQVIFAAILSVVFLQENMTPVLGVGITAIFLGEILISFSYPQSEGKGAISSERFRKGVAVGFMGGFLWGSAQLFAKEGVRGLGSSIMASFITYLFAILAQSVFVISFARRKVKLERTHVKFLLASGTVSTIAVLVQYMALRSAPVVAVNPIVNTSPLITLLASYIFMRKAEWINKKVLFGAVAVVFGAVLVAMY